MAALICSVRATFAAASIRAASAAAAATPRALEFAGSELVQLVRVADLLALQLQVIQPLRHGDPRLAQTALLLFFRDLLPDLQHGHAQTRDIVTGRARLETQLGGPTGNGAGLGNGQAHPSNSGQSFGAAVTSDPAADDMPLMRPCVPRARARR